MLALHHGFASYDFETRKLTLIADPEKDLPTRFNDGKCDPAGRFWAGTMSLTGQRAAGNLYRLDADFSVHPMLEGVGTSNGIAWSRDAKTMYYIDTPTREVSAFDYDIETGAIARRRVAVKVPESDGYPDGMTMDEEGMLWVAHWNGFRVNRWNPKNGELLHTVPLPVRNVTSCAFGGANLDQLFITTAQDGSPDKIDPTESPNAGGLFCISLGVRGLPAFEYAG